MGHDSITGYKTQNKKHCKIVKYNFPGIVSLLFRQEKDIFIAWMQEKHHRVVLKLIFVINLSNAPQLKVIIFSVANNLRHFV